MWYLVPWRPLFNLLFFAVVFGSGFFAFTFLTTFGFFSVFFITAFFFIVLFFFDIGVSGFDYALVGWGCYQDRSLFERLNTSEFVASRVGFLLHGSQPRLSVDRQSSVQLIPANKLLFMVSHIYRSKEGVHQVVEVSITAVNVVISEFSDALEVVERNLVVFDSHIANEVFHFTIGSFVQIGQNSVLHLGIVLVLLVGANLAVNLVAEDVLVSQQILDF